MANQGRIYTRTGDDGTTGLIGEQRVKKDALRIEAYGTVDELSSVIGLARMALAGVLSQPPLDRPRATETATKLDAWLAWTQDILFNLGCELAAPPENRAQNLPHVTQRETTALENAIDAAQEELDPLAQFIHPGGSYPGAFLHQARTVARRAERLIVTLDANQTVSKDALRYVNRLSDALFVWSRWINHALGKAEHIWNAQAQAPG